MFGSGCHSREASSPPPSFCSNVIIFGERGFSFCLSTSSITTGKAVVSLWSPHTVAESLGGRSRACVGGFPLTHIHMCVHHAGAAPCFQHLGAGPRVAEHCYCGSFQKLRMGHVISIIFFTFLLLDEDCHLPRKLSTLGDTGKVDASYLSLTSEIVEGTSVVF